MQLSNILEKRRRRVCRSTGACWSMELLNNLISPVSLHIFARYARDQRNSSSNVSTVVFSAAQSPLVPATLPMDSNPVLITKICAFCKSSICTGNDIKPRPCPVQQCETWTYEMDWEWCLGRPLLATSSSTVKMDNSSLAKTGIPRAHSPALVPCPSHSWICSLCASKEIRLIWNCPHCHDALCNNCDAINRCFGCGKSEWYLVCQNKPDEGERLLRPPIVDQAQADRHSQKKT
ncbi:hypothetical protein DFS33DRAFT_854000 [Desarmillaria ectypa]|nr:hypothetical protein DFS33DRAFT_854000 [Desarmillaria ectypa]